jgi:ribose transport system permease protein
MAAAVSSRKKWSTNPLDKPDLISKANVRGNMPRFDLGGLKKYAVLLVLLILIVAFSFFSPYFLSVNNLVNIVTQNSYFIIIGIGISFVMIGGGIDLSIGYQMSLVGVVMAMSMVVFHLPAWLSVLLGLMLGTFLGFINGFIIANLRVFPLIVTIATGTIFYGISYIISKSQLYRNCCTDILYLTNGKILGIPVDILIALFVVLLAGFIYSETVFGARIIALGGNEEASRLAGINTKKLKMVLYAICGMFTAIGTVIMLSKANSHSSSFGPGTEIIVLTASIIGGVSFMGGEGNVVGLAAGILLLGVIGNGMQLAGWGTFSQYIVKGVILLLAIAYDQYRKNSRR